MTRKAPAKPTLLPQKKAQRGKPFLPGHVGNPSGKNGADPELTRLKSESKKQLVESMHKILKMPVEECKVLAEANGSKTSDALMAAVMMKAITSGNVMSAQFFMTYTFGRPTEYDPNEMPEIKDPSKAVEGIPREVLVGVLRGLANAAKESATVS